MKLKNPSLSDRSSGVLLHITSLPSAGPIGTLGDEALKFVKFLSDAGQSWWQTLPVNPIGKGNSPYSTISSFAGEALLIDPKIWLRAGLIKSADLPKSRSSGKVHFIQARRDFVGMSRKAFAAFEQKPRTSFGAGMKAFLQREKYWLEDYSLFAAISDMLGTDWTLWPEGLRRRNAEALRDAKKAYGDGVRYHLFLQYSFDISWRNLRSFSKQQGIGLIGDIPIFVGHDSADVWSNQSQFWLNTDGSMKYVAGVPPDYFNKDGQLWGNALYNWGALEKDGFSFWVKRLKRLLSLYDVIRIDHFIGFFRYWQIPSTARSAKTGKWVSVPGQALFRKLRSTVGVDRLIAEDLGLLVPGVIKLRDDFDIPGMRVYQFGFGNGGGGEYHLPHNYPARSVAYTGTHDNDTVNGWYLTAESQSKSRKPSYDFDKMKSVLGTRLSDVSMRSIGWVSSSAANLAVFQLQDALGLDSKHRMNIPGTPESNWVWRMRSQPDAELAAQLSAIAKATAR
jgi:4-alpha-glucanotransferase